MSEKDKRGGYREGAGRPSVFDGKPAIIHIKTTPDSKARYVKKAQAEGKTLSEWVLDACNNELEK